MKLPAHIHPLADLLDLSAEEVLTAFRASQQRDFLEIVAEANDPGSALHQTLSPLGARGLESLFLDLHDHVMSHPVWRHPFFVRVFEGRITPAQAVVFACQYFNQIKNTRQCVALAIGRFHGLNGMNQPLSEVTQIALAQLVADEYGVGSHAIEDYPPLGHLLGARTHIAMYRQLFEGLGVPEGKQDVPMIGAVADNVLIQRLVAGHSSFTPLEALASVGLGMEWGVPEFFSLLLGGLIRLSEREGLGLTPHHLEVFIAHVRYDVLHAVSVMLVTSLHMTDETDLKAVKNACNTLMAGRYAMMCGLYHHVFGEPCGPLSSSALEGRYRLTDRRIETTLAEARAAVAPGTVVGGFGAMPFVW